ncbi:MAG: helix-turn-helix domain-containing GNAT family N-acetyltransferase [Saprospiraceae bacterium]|nr:helix-turn-helix domain-containing GNAT family N-acetyltransferase [Saprospiraceae bacterium]
MDFFEQTGVMALGSRLRQLSDQITRTSAQTYAMQGMDFEPRWFPVFFVLSKQGPQSVSVLADIIGQSHASVSQIASQMRKKGLVEQQKSAQDGRQNVLKLSTAGEALIPSMEELCQHVEKGVVDLLAETDHNIWQAINDLERALAEEDLFSRIQKFKRAHDASLVEIVPYNASFREAFRAINVHWIQQYFTMEAADYKALDNPETYILEPGGHIFIALFKGEAVGACAMIKMDDASYELAKMGVLPAARGKQIGWRLGQAVIQKAREMGAKRLFLESNTQLTPALNLYYKLGFERIIGRASPYERSDIQMELFL